ncbi:MAG: electron transfer flavoprotein subunit alpha [Chloroflexi bacterium]|nr:MAG: electron transfer flavoprotein subunit alpha [Chloroflexota bacterium]RLC96232.1 MAG: electron transfer flavoprotein subunit alpha [Chloroflexota bacterium]
MADYKGVLICGDVVEGKLAAITGELLGCGRKLADTLGEELSAVLVGSGVKGLAQEAIAQGADKVYVVDDPLLQNYQPDVYVAAVEKAVKQVMPKILLMGQTSVGRDLAPRLAFRLDTVLSMDCVDLDIDPDSKLLLQTRPVYGGNARAIFTTDRMPQMATVRSKAMSALEPDASRQGEVIEVPAEIDESVVRVRFVEKVKEEVAGVKLEDAPVVVSGGRGMGGPEGFQQLEELARLFKGAVGSTRPAVDNGWVPSTTQVGLTGKIVTPDLYIAVALSGSSQHMAGCSGAKTIVAINKDPEANIFREAGFGIVGDWKQALPAFKEKVKELLAG